MTEKNDLHAAFDAYYAKNWPLCKASIEKGTASEEIIDEREALWDTWKDAWHAALAARDAQAESGAMAILPDGSAFFTASLPLPKDHWLYAPRCEEWDDKRDTTADTPHPILTHAQRDAVVAAVRYAIRGATMCGKDADFDPDALVQNAVYALCGPFGFDDVAAPSREHVGETEKLHKPSPSCDPADICAGCRCEYNTYAAAPPSRECGERQLSEEQRNALRTALTALTKQRLFMAAKVVKNMLGLAAKGE